MDVYFLYLFVDTHCMCLLATLIYIHISPFSTHNLHALTQSHIHVYKRRPLRCLGASVSAAFSSPPSSSSLSSPEPNHFPPSAVAAHAISH